MATHSSILARKIPWTEEPGGLQSMGVPKSRTRLSDFTFAFRGCADTQGGACVPPQGCVHVGPDAAAHRARLPERGNGCGSLGR